MRKLNSKREEQIYFVWSSMKQRCLNPNNAAYKNYGGRGIKICDEWNDFDIFINDMGIPPSGWSLERLQNDEGYNKFNCVWSTWKGQCRNKRVNKYFYIDEKKMILKEFTKENGLNYHTIKNRLRKGMSFEQSIFKGKYPNNNIYGKDKNGRFINKDFHGRLCAIEERNKK